METRDGGCEEDEARGGGGLQPERWQDLSEVERLRDCTGGRRCDCCCEMVVTPPTQAQREALQNRPTGPVVMRQEWAGLGFFHWQIDAEAIASRLPAGLHVDTYDGSAWLGVVPFFMRRVRPVLLPPVPWLSWFLELNVRTYVYDDHGRAGVWFFSLDCNQPLAVEVARRFFHLPYEHATMRATRTAEGMIDYVCRRKTELEPARCRYPSADSLAPSPAEPGSLEWFLVERYLLFSADSGGRLFIGRVHHAPYQVAALDPALYPGTALPMVWDRFVRPIEPPASAMVAQPVKVRIYRLERMKDEGGGAGRARRDEGR